MKFLVLSGLLLASCASKAQKPVAASLPASTPVAKEEKKLQFRKFFLNYLKTATEEDDCVYLESRESEKTLHFMFVCGDRLVHVGFLK